MDIENVRFENLGLNQQLETHNAKQATSKHNV